MDKKVILVTGGSRGIGRAVCLAFAGAGSRVAVNYNLSREQAESLCSEINSAGGEAIAVKADVSSAVEVDKMVSSIVDRYGKIDVLVNNAGISKGGLLMLLDEASWDEVISINLKGVYNASKSVVRHMIGERKGIIINISSLGGITGLAGETPYCASKGGIIAFTKALSKEVAGLGILVNCVAPGAIDTEMLDGMPPEARDKLLELIPLKRLGRPEEVAGVVTFLASQAATYITGETIVVSGGLP